VTLRCLLVDDSPWFLEAARTLLERQGLTIVGVASTCEETFAQVADLSPDVVLLDIDLGEESGLALAERLHTRPGLARPPIILISTHAEEDYADLIAQSPAVGFLPKSGLSAGAIRDLLHGGASGSSLGPVSGRPRR
jgi:DNA-binding NarL/FixJ family response regulator